LKRESHQNKRLRLERITQRLRQIYPDAHCELHFRNPLELLVATILSAQSTDRQVNLVTANLFRKYRTASDYAETKLADLEQDLRSIGLFRNKAKNIQACCRTLMDRYHGNVPGTLAELIELDGVGRKTANVVLGNAFNVISGIVVDTHVARLSRKFGLTSAQTPEKIEAELQQLVSESDWILFSHWLIWHGRRRCSARKPDCVHCEVRDLCPSSGQTEGNPNE
jgi:endonuclease III